MRVSVLLALVVAVAVSAVPIEDAGADVDEAALMEPAVHAVAPLDADTRVHTRLLAAQSVRSFSCRFLFQFSLCTHSYFSFTAIKLHPLYFAIGCS